MTQRTAWFMMHRIRLVMQTGTFSKMSGEVEVDETFTPPHAEPRSPTARRAWNRRVEPFHLFRYLDEQSFRFNKRKGTDRTRFVDSLRNILGKRLTYKSLTGDAPALATT